MVAPNTKRLVAVNKCDKQEEWTEGDGTGEDRFYQKGRPATQNENVNKQSGEEKEKNMYKEHN